ncbi:MULTISPECIES: hypothetical protein [unclassified Bartonella]|uniref:hypothetical protein n=1 Tax=unclassified Bartonella TaxID=2645622 RepID=UPI0035CF41B9
MKVAVSIGVPSKNIMQQIIGVAAGSKPTDAVNLRQLQDLEEVVRKKGGNCLLLVRKLKIWVLDSTINFSSGVSNFRVKRDKNDENKLILSLANDIALKSITLGEKTKVDATGLVITDVPQITTGSINAASKQVTNVAEGTSNTDAVNFSQLKGIKEQVAVSIFVK